MSMSKSGDRAILSATLVSPQSVLVSANQLDNSRQNVRLWDLATEAMQMKAALL